MFLDLRRPRVEFSNFDFWALLRVPKGPQNQRNRVRVGFKKFEKIAEEKNWRGVQGAAKMWISKQAAPRLKPT